MTSDSFMIRSSSPSIFTSVPDHLPNKTRSPALRSIGIKFAGFVAGAGADGNDLAFLRLFLGRVGNNNAALRLLLAFNPAKDDAVVQRSEFHGVRSLNGVNKEDLALLDGECQSRLGLPERQSKLNLETASYRKNASMSAIGTKRTKPRC